MEAIAKIPIEFYAVLGFMILSNVGSIVAFVKVLVKRETEIALIQHTLDSIKLQLTDIKAFQDKASKDIHEAHSKIRELKILQTQIKM